MLYSRPISLTFRSRLDVYIYVNILRIWQQTYIRCSSCFRLYLCRGSIGLAQSSTSTVQKLTQQQFEVYATLRTWLHISSSNLPSSEQHQICFVSLNIWSVYIFWAMICAIGLVVLGLWAPENKGVPMEKKEELFSGHWWVGWKAKVDLT